MALQQFINNLIQGSAKPTLPNMEVSGPDSLQSCTKAIQWTEVVPTGNTEWACDYSLLFGDVPGLDNSEAELTDVVIVNMIKENLEDRCVSWVIVTVVAMGLTSRARLRGLEKPSARLGIILLQDATEVIPRLPALIGNIDTQLHGRVLRNVAVVSNKWSRWTGSHNEDPEGSQATLSSPNPGPSEEMRSHQNRIIERFSANIPAGVVAYDANWAEGDEWRIVESLVDRVVTGNCVLQLKPDPSTPATHSWLKRWFDWMICESLPCISVAAKLTVLSL